MVVVKVACLDQDTEKALARLIHLCVFTLILQTILISNTVVKSKKVKSKKVDFIITYNFCT